MGVDYGQVLRFMDKFFNEIHGLTMTIMGTGLVLITLSGSTRTTGIWITLIGIAAHLIWSFFKKD